jgi:hypothetical protein
VHSLLNITEESESRRTRRAWPCRWEDNVKSDVGKVKCEDVDWIHLPQDRSQWRFLVNTVISLRIT